MKNSNIDVDIIDETLLYICIDGNREHISVDNARIKYAKNSQVLTMIDDILAKYKENSEHLAPAKEETTPTVDTPKQEPTLKDLNDMPLEDIQIDLGDAAQQIKSEPVLADLNNKHLKEIEPAVHKEPAETKKDVSLKGSNNAPLNLVDESKFASIYDKHNSRIRETFPTDSPSFLDVEKLTRNNKPLEHIK